MLFSDTPPMTRSPTSSESARRDRAHSSAALIRKTDHPHDGPRGARDRSVRPGGGCLRAPARRGLRHRAQPFETTNNAHPQRR